MIYYLYFSAVFIERDELPEIWKKLLDPDFKGALFSSEEHVAYMNQRFFPRAFFHTAEEIIFSFNLCIYMHRQSCLTQEINHNILKLQSCGMLEAWSKKFVDPSFLKERTFNEPKVMVVQQLLGSYELLFIGLILSLKAFIFEVISTKISFLRKFMKKL